MVKRGGGIFSKFRGELISGGGGGGGVVLADDYVRGRLQRTSAKISDFQTTPLPLSGCVRISKTTPLLGRPLPDF